VKRANQVAWGLVAGLALVLVVGIGLLVTPWWKAYRVAKHSGDGADLRGAFLIYAPLNGASLHRAKLTEATLSSADLRGTNLNWVDLRRANLQSADLRGARVIYSELQRANLRDANLIGVDLGLSDLSNVDLRGADLLNADLETSDLKGARYDEQTRWPSGFDPVKAGAVLVK
jgi:uncharacterized protein YjbI with pentapeptide repeats